MMLTLKLLMSLDKSFCSNVELSPELNEASDNEGNARQITFIFDHHLYKNKMCN